MIFNSIYSYIIKSENRIEREKIMKRLYDLLNDYFSNDKDIEISFENNEIMIEINEKYYYRELRIFNENEFIYIKDFLYSEEEDEIELLKINKSIYDYLNQDNKMNLFILRYIQDFIDIIE